MAGWDWSVRYNEEDDPRAQLLAFALKLSSRSLSQGHLVLEIPRAVFEAVPAEAFRAVFSDVLLDAAPDLEARLQTQVVAGGTFRAELRLNDSA
ncbi:MAG: hypothetical protein ACO2Z5_06415 [Burkholderiaceae bacterium]|jgi:hypothetical protein